MICHEISYYCFLFVFVILYLNLEIKGVEAFHSNRNVKIWKSPQMSDNIQTSLRNNRNKWTTDISMVGEYKVNIPLGEGYKDVECKFRPIFAASELLVVTYKVPFSLNIEKPPKGFPAPVVNRNGAGGEKVGDILRATTCWSQGFNAAGATSDIMMFAGNVKWRKSIFDTTGAPWQQVVDALVSNTAERSEFVTLIFEREKEEEEEVTAVTVGNPEGQENKDK